MRAREADLVADALRLLRLRGIPAWRTDAGAVGVDGNPIRMAPAGTADILGIAPGGRFLAVACQRPGGRLRPAQRAFRNAVQAAGGVALVIGHLAALDRALTVLAAKARVRDAGPASARDPRGPGRSGASPLGAWIGRRKRPKARS